MDSTIDIQLFIPEEKVAESVTCTPLGERLFRLESLPFFLEGVAFGDTFEAEKTATGLQLTRVVSRSGRRVLQILLTDYFRNSAALQAILGKVEENGGRWTQASGLLSISMPAEATYDPAIGLDVN